EVDTRHDTVGCIAVTDDLRIAAGASSGGRTGKPAGRIGDAAIGGAGAYADANCAVVCTGTGEIALRTAMAQRAAHECRRRNPGAAAHWAITTAAEQGGEMGVIVYDQLSGNVAVAHNTAYFAVLLRNGSDQPLLTPRTGDVLVRPAPGGSPVQSPARLAQPWV
ncbi:MAG TPA: isoaspartyl peptidase/L-asparaginase, partial [Pilimelia sp.]|nr:isoaspartyl peptidase/L-asparaginase [Pilimelia sp.]